MAAMLLYRCTMYVTVSAPGGDPAPGNNSASVAIDVTDRNDY